MSALYSGRVALNIMTTRQARTHLEDLAKAAPDQRTNAIVYALAEHVKQVEDFLSEFLEACKEEEAAKYVTTKEKEPAQ